MTDMFTCFGYGSLVNRATLPEDSVSARVRVRGWRRAWRHSVGSDAGRRCTLTVIPDPNCSILGTVVAQPGHHDDTMQRREALYHRVDIPSDDVDWLDQRPDGWPEPFIHVGEPAYNRPGDHDHPVLLSYVETVMSGFFRTFGDDGPRHFLETTADWHVPVMDDRTAPIYSRATQIDDIERSLIDGLLDEIGVTRISMPRP